MVAKNANNTTSNMARVLNVVELIEEQKKVEEKLECHHEYGLFSR
jgi:hypothetical protein